LLENITPEQIEAQISEIEKKRGGKPWTVSDYIQYKQIATTIELADENPAGALAMLILYIKQKKYKVEIDEEDFSIRIQVPQILLPP